jgi:hypothetical protein
MYRVERSQTALIVRGPEGFERILDPAAIGVVVRPNVSSPHDELVAYTVPCGLMTEAEQVALALEIESYPI